MVTQNSYWTYKGKIVNTIEDIPEGVVGFIYRISSVDNEWSYIGKKNFYSFRTLPPLKGMKRKRKVVKESDWLTYTSSNKTVKEYIKNGGDKGIKREILMYCTSKKLLTYYENKFLYCNEVIEPKSNYLNDNISGKMFKSDWDKKNNKE